MLVKKMTGSEIGISRRALLANGFALAVNGCDAKTENTGPYPSHGINFIIPNAAGGSADLYARLLGAALEKRLPRTPPVIPMNFEAGGGGKGVSVLYRAAPDGYTIGILTVPGIFALQHVRQLPYDFARFTWLASLTDSIFYGLAVPSRSPARNIEDLLKISESRPVLFGATGPEATAYSATIIATRLLGIRARLVTGYKGANDYVMGAFRGDTDAVVTPLPVIRPMVQSGMLRALASFEPESSIPGVPDATTLGRPELASITVERVIAGPPGLPGSVSQILSEALLQCIEDRKVVEYSKRLGERILPRDAQKTAAIVASNLDLFHRWSENLR